MPEIKAPTDAIVKITKTTICGTDLHFLKGDVPTCTHGRTLGHEGISVAEKIEPGIAVFRQETRASNAEVRGSLVTVSRDAPIRLCDLLVSRGQFRANLPFPGSLAGAPVQKAEPVFLPLSARAIDTATSRAGLYRRASDIFLSKMTCHAYGLQHIAQVAGREDLASLSVSRH